MCGIAGFFSTHRLWSEADLRSMTDCLSHRGPDADGFYLDREHGLGLGHRRLSILDLSTAANQPMPSHDGRYQICFNGEVYNFREIADQLGIHTHTTSDTEVILEAFARLGTDFVHLLNGMFAIAIYDTQEHTLYVFRDRLGVKPVIYYWHDGNFAFASEIKALLRLSQISQHKKIDKQSVYNFLYAGYIPGPHTIYQSISRLPSGSYAVIRDGQLDIKSYWQPESKIATTVLSDFQTAKSSLKELLGSAVRYRMISDVPFGVFLSGGIDSSTVAAIAQDVSDETIKTFSIGVKDDKMDESAYARRVSEHLGTEHYEFIVSEKESLELVDRILTAYDEPYADSSAIPTMLVSRLARQHVTMTLSGDGGDELFMGYGAHAWAERLDTPFVKPLRQPIRTALSLLSNRYKRAAGIFDYDDERHLKSHIFSQEQYLFSERELHRLMQPAYIYPLIFNEEYSGLARPLSAKEQQALFDIKYYLKDDLLVKVDVASMQFSLEARTPFLDYRVVEFALNLNEQLKVKNGISKHLLKEVLYDYVPRQYFARPKKGFSIPLIRWLHKDLKYLLDKYLSRSVVEQAEFVDYSEVATYLRRFEAGEDYLYNRLWALMLLHKWSSQ
ncbi:MAG: asparagine synthase (glutamine-hydrolyzing) [Bacteroidetes bacterium]|nr:asparagine synthase (glutamine-hydrolyzing) [Bacteroidota bacterium]